MKTMIETVADYPDWFHSPLESDQDLLQSFFTEFANKHNSASDCTKLFQLGFPNTYSLWHRECTYFLSYCHNL